MKSIPEVLFSLEYAEKLRSLCSSFQSLTGQELVSGPGDLVRALWTSPRVIVAHGTESDPLFFFGNRRALEVWEMSWDQFRRMPSRMTAEPVQRAERDRLLEEVSRRGYIANYSGIRITRSGKRFKVTQAVVWNITDPSGARLGQAAAFESVEWV